MSNTSSVVHQEISELLNRYCWGYDCDDMELLGSVFSENASTGGVIADTEQGWGPWKGRELIVEELSRIRKSQSDRRRHIIGSQVFDVVSDDLVKVKVYLSLHRYAENLPPELVTTGEYQAVARKHKGVWLLDQLDEVLESAF